MDAVINDAALNVIVVATSFVTTPAGEEHNRAA